MKAIRVHQFGAPSVMRLEEVADPHPGADQVVVRVRAVGVNPVDTYIRSGAYGNLPALPYTPGVDAAGVVTAIGEKIEKLNVGDRVYTSGTVTGAYAEFVLCEATQVHRLPVNVTFAQGAGVNIPYATAYRALFQKAMAKPGETVLIHGASGGVGTAAVQLAIAHGLQVIGTAGTERGLQLVRDQGAHHVLDHRRLDYLTALHQLTGGRGVDVILEMLANVNLSQDLSALAMHGRVVVVGSRGRVEIAPRDLMVRDATVLGMLLMHTTPEEKAQIHAALAAGLANETLQPVIGLELPLAEADRAHEVVMSPGASGKVVLLP